MAYRLFVDSANGVSLDPEWDYEDGAKKLEDRHRTRTGAEYVYKWAEYRTIKFGIMFVNSAPGNREFMVVIEYRALIYAGGGHRYYLLPHYE